MDIIKKIIDSFELTETKRVFNGFEIQVGDLIKVHRLSLEKGVFGENKLDVHENYMKGVVSFSTPDSIRLTSYVQVDDEPSTVRITIEEVYTPDINGVLTLGTPEFEASIIPVLEERINLFVLEVV